MKTVKILVLCLLTSFGYAQKKLSKTSQSIKVNKDVVVDLNTSYAEIEISTWNKDIVEVEAYLESDELSEEELERALKAWNLKVEGADDKVTISSRGGRAGGLYHDGDYALLLKDLEFELADLPEMPEMPAMPVLPEIVDMIVIPEMPEMPEMPEFPELPELPDGIKTISFDYDKYQKEGEKYLEEWSKKYEKEGGKELQEKMEAWAKKFSESGYQEKMQKWGEEYGKRFEGDWAKDMEKWGEEFGEKFGEKYAKDMEKWGEEFGEKFGKEWAEKMEKWGERFGREMEKRVAKMERDTERMAEREARMEERKAAIAERHAERKEALTERRSEMEERRSEMRERREAMLARRLESGSNSKVKKVIKIKIPKNAKLKTNIRHGELKLSSVIYNMKGDISHSSLLAQGIDGSDTSINTSYSEVLVNDWVNGTLGLKFVDNALLKNVEGLTLNSNSSNISIDNLSGNNIIDGSFGELTIHNILDAFNNLNIVLENSEAWVKLPSVEYDLMFRGDRSKFNNEYTKTKTINGTNSGKSIVINAKYSNVTMN